MKNILYIFLFFAFISNGFGQAKPEIFTVVATMPEFPGGKDEMAKYLDTSINHTNRHTAVSSTMGFIKFVVDTNGNILEPVYIKSCGSPSWDRKGIEVVKNMPRWSPGKQNGKKVFVYMAAKIRIDFSRNQYDAYIEEQENKKKADKFYNDGVKNIAENKNEEAIDNFKKCLSLFPDDIDALYNVSATYIKLNQKNKACENLNRIKLMGKPDADELIKQFCIN